MRPSSLPAGGKRDDPKEYASSEPLSKTDHSCSTAFCNSCAIHCGSLSEANRIGDPIFTLTCQGRASFFPACFSEKNPRILRKKTATDRLCARSPLPGGKGSSSPSVVGWPREKT